MAGTIPQLEKIIENAIKVLQYEGKNCDTAWL